MTGIQFDAIDELRKRLDDDPDARTVTIPREFALDLVGLHREATSRPDPVVFCGSCEAVTPHRWRPSPEAGTFWRCSECNGKSPYSAALGRKAADAECERRSGR